MAKKSVPNPNFHRKNGVSWPLDPLQVMTWVLTALIGVTYFAIHFPLFPKPYTFFWVALFLVCYILGIVLFVFATLEEHKLPPLISPDDSHSCDYCHKSVPSGSKHCRLCNQCRFGFDHHCRFINNCVTESNYLVFFIGCCFLVSTTIINIALLIVSAVEFKDRSEEIIQRQTDYYRMQTSKVTFWVLFAISLFTNVGIFVPLLILTIYHAYFQRRAISTYDYLLKIESRIPIKMRSFAKRK